MPITIRRHGHGRYQVAVSPPEGAYWCSSSPITAIYSDDFGSYDWVGDEDAVHESVNHRPGGYVRGIVHTNAIQSAWSLFDRAVIGAYHKLSVEHMPAYLSEFEWRFNNRDNPFLFRDTLCRLMAAEAQPYKALVAG